MTNYVPNTPFWHCRKSSLTLCEKKRGLSFPVSRFDVAHSFIHSFIHSLTHSLTLSSFIHSFIHCFIHSVFRRAGLIRTPANVHCFSKIWNINSVRIIFLNLYLSFNMLFQTFALTNEKTSHYEGLFDKKIKKILRRD